MSNVGWGLMSNPMYANYLADVRLHEQSADEFVEKALTTGQGLVADGDTGATALRQQFLYDTLEQVAWEQDDCTVVKEFPVEKVYSTIVEFSTYDNFGETGDGFISETGGDGAFNSYGVVDDSFTRRTRTVKFMATEREVGVIAQNVRNIADVTAQAEKGAMMEILRAMELAYLYSDETLNNLGYSGMEAQIWDAVRDSPDSGIDVVLYDAKGYRVDAEMLADIQAVNAKLFGEGSVLMQGIEGHQQTAASLFPLQRGPFGGNANLGGDVDSYNGHFGKVKLKSSKMLRPNRPLNVLGVGADGKPRTTADNGATFTWASTPFSTVPTTVAASTEYWFNNCSRNTNANAPTTAPALPPTGSNLEDETYYYAASIVYRGRESVAWVYGASAAGNPDAATGIAVDPDGASPIVKITIASGAISGLTTAQRKLIRVRIYRAQGVTPPTRLSQFDLLQEIAYPVSGNAILWDNGMFIPGCETDFLLTKQRAGRKSVITAQLLPVIKRALPQKLMSERFGLIAAHAPILFVPQHHMVIRNVGTKQR